VLGQALGLEGAMGGELRVADSSTVGGEIVVRNDSLLWWEEVEMGG
jgi:hypothetical protein